MQICILGFIHETNKTLLTDSPLLHVQWPTERRAFPTRDQSLRRTGKTVYLTRLPSSLITGITLLKFVPIGDFRFV